MEARDKRMGIMNELIPAITFIKVGGGFAVTKSVFRLDEPMEAACSRSTRQGTQGDHKE